MPCVVSGSECEPCLCVCVCVWRVRVHVMCDVWCVCACDIQIIAIITTQANLRQAFSSHLAFHARRGGAGAGQQIHAAVPGAIRGANGTGSCDMRYADTISIARRALCIFYVYFAMCGMRVRP